jgi:triphosphatase
MIKPPRETELKLAVDAADLPRLRQRLQRFGGGQVQHLENVYHDTEDFALARSGMALRLRRVDRRWLQTLKTDDPGAALSRRGEWEWPAPRARLELARFASTPLAAWRRRHPRAQIVPRFRTRFERTVWTTPDASIEIALDQGEILAGDRSTPLCEVELELKDGEASALWTLALELIGTGKTAIALLALGESKASRGVRLALGDNAQPMKANAKAFASALTSRMSAGAALRSIVATGTRILLANAHGLRENDDPEFIHQARVAVRRMRSAIRLFEDDVEFPPRLAAGLRWIGRELGRARDWDVIVLHTLPTLAPTLGPQLSPLAMSAAKRRDEARQNTAAILAGARFAALALKLAQWSETPAADTITLRALAPRSLRRAHRRLLKSARFFIALPPTEQHRVRIHAKRLRYATDVLACALAGGAVETFSAKLSALQDLLGAMNDVAITQEKLPRLAPRSSDLESMQGALAQRRVEHAIASEAALAALARMPPPWR